MDIFRALLLSSKSQAETFEYRPPSGVIAGIIPRFRYRLLAAHYEHSPLQEPQEEIFTLHIYRVSYPEKVDGKGWGKPRYAEKAHYETQQSGISAFREYLEKWNFHPEEGWEPVEDEEREQYE